MNPKNRSEKRSKADKKDVALMVARAAFSVIPLGGPVATLLSGFKPGYAKQLIKDVEEIDDRLICLEDKIYGFKAEALKNDESFKAIIAHWVQIAIRTSEQEKREALRNAVLNLAIRDAEEGDLRSTFFKWIDDLEPAHLRILHFLNDPIEWAKRNSFTFPNWLLVAVFDVLSYVFPKLRNRLDFYAKGLIDRELLKTQNLHLLVNETTALSSSTTPIGRQFLAFISSPVDNNENSLQHAEETSKAR